MLKLSLTSLDQGVAWEKAGIELPRFDQSRMRVKTAEKPLWVHFGSGNIFRGFIAMLQQKLLNCGAADTGIIAAETYDEQIIDLIYRPHDNLSLLVIMNPDGSLEKKVVGSISESLVGDPSRPQDWQRLKTIFIQPSLQFASFTITEKGYRLKNLDGTYNADIQGDLIHGPAAPKSVMAKVAALLYERYQQGACPIALVSMDNCSHNGEIFHQAVAEIVEKWVAAGVAVPEFLDYINDPNQVSFPWSMIDKITPRPSETVKRTLNDLGINSTDIVCTDKKTYIAPFVNAEGPQYLVVEDRFPNGRLPLEKAGVYFTDRQTVEKMERMKVCTCLNPLHTSLAVFGCLLDYSLIADEMKDPCLKKLVEKIGYEEGMPVVTNPGILDPKEFIKEVLDVRLPNPFIPDTPQRIATDTSQKVGIRFGETIKAYLLRPDLDAKGLKYIPLVIAGWCRYLMGLDDHGCPMELSSDPMLDLLQTYVAPVQWGDQASVGEHLRPLLSNEAIFGVNLYEAGLGGKIEAYLGEMIAGNGAVRATLEKYLAGA